MLSKQRYGIIGFFLSALFVVAGPLFGQDSPIEKTESPVAKKAPSASESIAMDAVFSYNRGELFRAYKLFLYLDSRKSKVLYSNKIFPSYVKTVSALKGNSELNNICSNVRVQTDNTRYICAKEFYELSDYQSSNKILNSVKSKDQEQVKLLKASNFLALGSPNKCVKELQPMKAAKSKVKDLVFLSLGRCHMALRNYDLAAKAYKSIGTSSTHYMDSLFELAWSQFKGREIGESKETIDVLLSSYSDFKDDRSQVSQREYFDLRYLRAYLGLVQSGASDVVTDMDIALGDLKRIEKSSRFSVGDINEITKLISKGNLTRVGLYDKSPNLKKISDLSSNWGTRQSHELMHESLEKLIALSLELKAYQKNSNTSYRTNLKSLQKVAEEKLKKRLLDTYQVARNSISGFELRVELAKRKQNILQTTKGIRNLEQAKDLYTQKVNSLSDFLGEVR